MARSGRPEHAQHDGPKPDAQRCRGTRRASGENAAGGGRESRDIPSGRRRDPVRPRSGHSRSPHARRLGANVDQRQDGGKGQDRGRCRNRRVTAQDAVRRNSLRPDGQNAPPPPRVGERRATTKKRVDRSHLGPHEAAQEPMLARSPPPPFFTRKDQVLDLRYLSSTRSAVPPAYLSARSAGSPAGRQNKRSKLALP